VTEPLAIVIVNWNACAHLRACLRAAVPLGRPVVVVDNASGDGSAAMVARDFPTVELIASRTNLGFAGGVNAGMRATATPWVLVLNPDVIVDDGSVARLLEGASAAAAAGPPIGAAGGCLIGEDGRPQAGFAVRRFPTLATFAVDLLLVDKVWPANPVTRRYLAADLDLTVDQDVEQPAAACLLVRREAFDAVAGFDEGFHPAWFEDVDFCRRLHVAGWRIRYVAAARPRHEGGVAMRSLGLTTFAPVWYRNMTRYVDRHFSGPARITYRLLLVVGVALRVAASLVRGRPADARAYAACAAPAFRYPSRHG
jgi:N-acetylglucosaminyl-diphospho-decaprenol L-rhamnosyltransferase